MGHGMCCRPSKHRHSLTHSLSLIFPGIVTPRTGHAQPVAECAADRPAAIRARAAAGRLRQPRHYRGDGEGRNGRCNEVVSFVGVTIAGSGEVGIAMGDCRAKLLFTRHSRPTHPPPPTPTPPLPPHHPLTPPPPSPSPHPHPHLLPPVIWLLAIHHLRNRVSAIRLCQPGVLRNRGDTCS